VKQQFWGLWLIIVLLGSAWGAPIIEGGDPEQPWLLSREEARLLVAQRHPPVFPARAALIFDMEDSRVLLDQNGREPLPPASLTKLMTALVAREHLHLKQTVTVPQAASVGESSMGLQPGQHVHVETLLYGLLLNSGNDAAITLAIAAAGDEKVFVHWMNKKAQELGLQHTHFLNPHGLDAAGHVSTARDLARIAQAVLQDPVLAQIVRTKEIHLDGWHLVNRNALLRERDNVIGVKTGTTLLAGQCLIAAFQDQGHTIITVVLGARDRYATTLALWNYYKDVYTWQRLDIPNGHIRELQAGTMMKRFQLKHTPQVLLPRWQARHLIYRWQINEPVKMGDGWHWPSTPGQVHFYVDGDLLKQIPLVWDTASSP